MSTAFYPLGMKSMSSSGYTHKSALQNKQYIPWKGTGINSFPIGTAAGNIRPLTNNDSGNVFPTGFGLPRPIKHFRKGRVIPPNDTYENDLVQYNIDRYVKSSRGASLVGEMQDRPGSYIVKLNEESNEESNNECNDCKGFGIVASYKPNIGNLTQDPSPETTNPVWCCNQERNARRRTIYASTNLKKNYFTTSKQYLQNRCKTYEQKAFNFLETPNQYAPIKPGSPLATEANTYLANCQPNSEIYGATEYAFVSYIMNILLEENIITQSQYDDFISLNINSIQGLFTWIKELDNEMAIKTFDDNINNPYWGILQSYNPVSCQLTVYKPNNYQFAKQGAVDNSTRLLKLNVDTVTTNAYSIKNNYSNTLKSKTPDCNASWPLNVKRSIKYQKYCSK